MTQYKTPSNPANAHSGQSAAVPNIQSKGATNTSFRKAGSGSAANRSGGMKSEGELNKSNTSIPKNDFA
jgi:hypothetical protein